MRLCPLLFILACSTSSPSLPWHDGTRLKAAHYTTSDGLDVPFDIYDTNLQLPSGAVLNVRCEPSSNGFCVPAADTVALIAYADAQCQSVIAVGAVNARLAEDPYGSRFYEIGAPLPQDTSFYYESDGVCTAGVGAIAAYTLGSEIPNDTFVSVSPYPVKLDARYDVEGFKGSEGSIFFPQQGSTTLFLASGFQRSFNVLTELFADHSAALAGGTCYPVLGADDTLRCLPLAAYLISPTVCLRRQHNGTKPNGRL